LKAPFAAIRMLHLIS